MYQGRRDADLEIGDTAGLEICATNSIQTGKGHPKFSNAEGKGMDGKGMKAAGFVSQFPCRLFRCRFPVRVVLPVRKGFEANERFGRSAVQGGRLDVPHPAVRRSPEQAQQQTQDAKGQRHDGHEGSEPAAQREAAKEEGARSPDF